jgi:hypothetical protein
MFTSRVHAWAEGQRRFSFYAVADSSNRHTLRGQSYASIDTTLTPPRMQYGATQGKPEQRKPTRYAAFATPCTLLQRLKDHS